MGRERCQYVVSGHFREWRLRVGHQAEANQQGIQVGVHALSPGMVLTDLLLEGATPANKQIFNVLCEQPETVAAFLVPRARTVAGMAHTRYTPLHLVLRFGM